MSTDKILDSLGDIQYKICLRNHTVHMYKISSEGIVRWCDNTHAVSLNKSALIKTPFDIIRPNHSRFCVTCYAELNNNAERYGFKIEIHPDGRKYIKDENYESICLETFLPKTK
jgi:hypothetical protein